MSSTVNKRWVTVSQAADMLGVTPGRIRQLLATGEIRGEKLHDRLWAITLKEALRVAKRRAKESATRDGGIRR